jgi:uncharacterized protein (TIGR00106 family)
MKVIAEISIMPLNGGSSIRNEVALAQEILRKTGCPVEPHAAGTNIEGELEVVMEAIKRIHEELHAHGTARAISDVRLETRTDKSDSLRERAESMGRPAAH